MVNYLSPMLGEKSKLGATISGAAFAKKSENTQEARTRLRPSPWVVKYLSPMLGEKNKARCNTLRKVSREEPWARVQAKRAARKRKPTQGAGATHAHPATDSSWDWAGGCGFVVYS